MSSSESITLNPHEHHKLGILHYGVTREGRISVAGDPRDIADGESILFERSEIAENVPAANINLTASR